MSVSQSVSPVLSSRVQEVRVLLRLVEENVEILPMTPIQTDNVEKGEAGLLVMGMERNERGG